MSSIKKNLYTITVKKNLYTIIVKRPDGLIKSLRGSAKDQYKRKQHRIRWERRFKMPYPVMHGSADYWDGFSIISNKISKQLAEE